MADAPKVKLIAALEDGTELAILNFPLDRYKKAIDLYQFEEMRPSQIPDPANRRKVIPNPVSPGQYMGLEIYKLIDGMADRCEQMEAAEAKPVVTPENANEFVEIKVSLPA